MAAGPQVEEGMFAVKSEARLGTRNAHRCPKPWSFLVVAIEWVRVAPPMCRPSRKSMGS